MATNLPSLPLRVQKGIEHLKSWEGYSTPYDLIKLAAQLLSVDPNQLLQFEEIVYTDVQPEGLNAKKIWVKTDAPVGLGVPTGDGYAMIYPFPQNIPFLWVKGESNIPSYARKLNNNELENYGLTKPDADHATWIIVEL